MTPSSLTLPSPLLAELETAVTSDPALHSRHSVTQYRSHIRHFEDWRKGRQMTKSLVKAYAAWMQREGYAPVSINKRLVAIRWWVRHLIDQAKDSGGDPQAIEAAARVLTVESVRGSRLPRGRYLSPEETSALLSACRADTSPAGVRDAAMIAIALSVGLRRDDLTTLTLDAIRGDTGESCDLVIHGKGDRVDTLYLYDHPHGAYSLLKAWLSLRGQDPGRVFCPVLKNDRLDRGGKLSGESLRKILDYRQIGIGLPEHITWHDLRKTFICAKLDAGHDLATVHKLARHRDPKTTSTIYDIRGERALRAAMKGE